MKKIAFKCIKFGVLLSCLFLIKISASFASDTKNMDVALTVDPYIAIENLSNKYTVSFSNVVAGVSVPPKTLDFCVFSNKSNNLYTLTISSNGEFNLSNSIGYTLEWLAPGATSSIPITEGLSTMDLLASDDIDCSNASNLSSLIIRLTESDILNVGAGSGIDTITITVEY